MALELQKFLWPQKRFKVFDLVFTSHKDVVKATKAKPGLLRKSNMVSFAIINDDFQQLTIQESSPTQMSAGILVTPLGPLTRVNSLSVYAYCRVRHHHDFYHSYHQTRLYSHLNLLCQSQWLLISFKFFFTRYLYTRLIS